MVHVVQPLFIEIILTEIEKFSKNYYNLVDSSLHNARSYGPNRSANGIRTRDDETSLSADILMGFSPSSLTTAISPSGR